MRKELKDLGKPVRLDRTGLFHWRHGIHFGRDEENGDVTIWTEHPHRTAEEPAFPLVQYANIPFDEWVSIVHATAEPGADFYALRSLLGNR